MSGRPKAEIEAARQRGEWVCGRPRTPENSKPHDGPGGVMRCRACRQVIIRNHQRRLRAARRAVRA